MRNALRLGLAVVFSTCFLRVLVAAEAGVPGDWLSAAQKQIAEEEYQVTWQDRTQLSGLDAAWQAPNRAQGFRTYFTNGGIRVIPRTEETASWEWGLSLIGHGRGVEVKPVDAATLSPDRNRIEYRRGAIVEWYVNDSRGLEQGFSIARPPETIGATGRGSRSLSLSLALTGTLSPVISEDGLAIDFVTPQGARVVRYAELNVTDARGSRLPGRFEGFAAAGLRGIRILIDDVGAVYPIIVDPLATSASWIAENDQAASSFGWSVSTAGDVNGDGYST